MLCRLESSIADGAYDLLLMLSQTVMYNAAGYHWHLSPENKEEAL